MLPKTFDDENLFRLFSVYGELREVHIIRGPDGASKGCAFIKFVKTEASLIAMSDMNDIIPEVNFNEYLYFIDLSSLIFYNRVLHVLWLLSLQIQRNKLFGHRMYRLQ